MSMELALLISWKQRYLVSLADNALPFFSAEAFTPDTIHNLLSTNMNVSGDSVSDMGLVGIRHEREDDGRYRVAYTFCVILKPESDTASLPSGGRAWLMLSELSQAAESAQIPRSLFQAAARAESNQWLPLDGMEESKSSWANSGSWNGPAAGWDSKQKATVTGAGLGLVETQILWGLWQKAVFPSEAMNLEAFIRFLNSTPELADRNCQDDTRLFRAFNTQDSASLTFPAFVTAIALLQPTTTHGGTTGNPTTTHGGTTGNCQDDTRLFRAFNTQDSASRTFPAFVTAIALLQPTTTHGGTTGNCQDDTRLFRAFNTQDSASLTFPAFVTAIALLQPTTTHGGTTGEARTRAIYRYYTESPDIGLQPSERRRILDDVVQCAKTPVAKQRVQDKLKDFVKERTTLRCEEFVQKVGRLEIRGTSVLLRFTNRTFPALKARVCDGALEKETGMKQEVDMKVRPEIPGPEMVEEETQTPSNPTYRLSKTAVTLGPTGATTESLLDHNDDDVVSGSARMEMETSMEDSQDVGALTFPEAVYTPGTAITFAKDMLNCLRFFQHPFFLGHRQKKPFSWDQSNMRNIGLNFLAVCKIAKGVVKQEPRCLAITSPAYILGDIHGDYEDLMVFEKTFWPLGPAHCPSRLLFLGDYVDRGRYSFEVVAYLLCQKILAPGRVHLLRGNHELSYLNRQVDLLKECQAKFGNGQGREVWEAVNGVFASLPLAAVLDTRIFCAHGGIPAPRLLAPNGIQASLEGVSTELELKTAESSPLAWHLLWNDPLYPDETGVVLDEDGFGANGRRGGEARVFSAAALTDFLARHGFSHFIRAHQIMKQGYQLRYSAQLVTVFSSSKAGGKGQAASLISAVDGTLSVLRINPKPANPKSTKASK